jgi:hypothetical protein
MKSLRPIIRIFAFILGLYALADFLIKPASFSLLEKLLLLSPVFVGILLGLISARAFVSREWQKGPAVVLAVAVFFQVLGASKGFFVARTHEADSWLGILLWVAVEWVWNGQIALLAIIVYRSSDHIFASVSKWMANLVHRKPQHAP